MNKISSYPTGPLNGVLYHLQALLLLVLVSSASYAQTIDNTFGVNGNVPSGGPLSNSEGNSGVGNCTVIQPDGKLVVAVDKSDPNQFDLNFYTYRYNSDGTPDASFGDNGVSRIFAGTNSKNYDLKIQPDGKIVVVGETEYCVNGVCGAPQFIMMRLLPNGAIDSTFGNYGKIITTDLFGTSGTYAKPLRVHLLSSGKFIVCGRGINSKPFVARLNTNGFPDAGYASNGIFTDTTTYYTFKDMVVNAQGETFGLAEIPKYINGVLDTANNSDVYILKLTAAGVPDMTFGTGGRMIFSVSNSDEPESIAIKPDQTLIVGGTYQPHNTYNSGIPWNGYGQTNEGFLAFVQANGTLSQALPNGYKTISVPGDSSTFIHKIIILSNNRLMISGRTNALVSGNFREKAFLGQVDDFGNPLSDFNGNGFMVFNYGQLGATGWNGTLACFNDIDVMASGDAYATGYYNPVGGNVGRALFLLKLNGVPPGAVGLTENSPLATGISVFPNPSSGAFRVKAAEKTDIKIYDENGSLVHSETIPASGNISLNLNYSSKGIYYISATNTSTGIQRTEKILLQ